VTGGRSAKVRLACPACNEGLTLDRAGASCPRCGTRYPEKEGILRLTVGSVGATSYDPGYFPALARAEDEHFWFVARREVILESLQRAVSDWKQRALFDIGCGTGGLIKFLSAAGIPIAGASDAYLEALCRAREKVEGTFVQVDEGRLPPLGAGQSLIGLFDVLEHLDDDRGTLAWLGSVLEPGGILVLTVPALPWLYSDLDAAAGHRRRYGRRELRQKLEAAGFEVRTLTHFMAPLLPPLVLYRWLLGRGVSAQERWNRELRIVPVVNSLLLALLRLERLWLRVAPMPVGSSLLAVAARPGTGAPREPR